MAGQSGPPGMPPGMGPGIGPGMPPGMPPWMPPGMPPTVPLDILYGLKGWMILSYLEVAATTIFVYDYMLTFGMELQLVWATKWSAIKVLYLFQRYLPFCDAGFLTLYRHLGRNLTKSQCQNMTVATGILTFAGAIASETLLTIRIWALWNRDSVFVFALPAGFLGIWIPASIAGYYYIHDLQYPDVPPFPNFQGCFIISDNLMVVWCWLALLIWDLLCLILVAGPGINSYRSGSVSRLEYVVYRDGTVYYLFLFVLSILNIIFSAIFPPNARVVTLSLTRCLHSMLASRVLLQLREQTHVGSQFSPTDIDFAERLDAIDTGDHDDTVVGRNRRSFAMDDIG